MKALNTLIRLSKKTLDELRRSMVELENQKAQLEQAIIVMQRELEAEVKLASKQLEMANFFGEFAKRITNRQDVLRQEIRGIDGKIKKLSDDIFAAFTELKKYEIAKDNVKQRELAEAKRKETLMLDEIASQQFHRKNTEA